MSDLKQSAFRMVSKGIVLQDKADGSDMILVDPIEIFPMDNGPVKAHDRKIESTYVDTQGVQKTAKAEAGSGVQAKWIAAESNRETAPDVRVGETVNLYQYADDPKYYWNTAAREPELRGKERVRFSFSNKDERNKEYDSDTSYWFEFDTKNKKIHLHTSDNDGEACTYDFVFDTRAGSFSLTDNLGNSIVLDSTSGSLVATTTEEIVMNTKRFIVNAQSSSTINAAQTSTINTPNSTINASAVSTINTPHHVENAERDTINTGAYELNTPCSWMKASDCGVEGEFNWSRMRYTSFYDLSTPDLKLDGTSTTVTSTTYSQTTDQYKLESENKEDNSRTTAIKATSSYSLETPASSIKSSLHAIDSDVEIEGDLDVSGKVIDVGGNTGNHSHTQYLTGDQIDANIQAALAQAMGEIDALKERIAALEEG